MPRIESSRTSQSPAKNSFSIDREATARVLEPAPEIKPLSAAAPAELPNNSPSQHSIESGHTDSRRIVPTPTVTSLSREADSDSEAAPLSAIDEIEPCDYLEAEVRRVDKAMSAQFSRNESPSLGTHVAINVLDLLVIAISCLPFLAAVGLSNGSFASAQTRAASIAMVALVSFFYLALTHCLCGKTIGMMLTNTRVVDATNFGDPSRRRALVRALGYFVAIAPAMIGLLWMAGNRKRRGWHDFISGTFVARDF